MDILAVRDNIAGTMVWSIPVEGKSVAYIANLALDIQSTLNTEKFSIAIEKYGHLAENFTPWKVYKEIPLPDPEIDVTQYSDGWYVGIFESGVHENPTPRIFRYDETQKCIVDIGSYAITADLIEVVGPVKTNIN